MSVGEGERREREECKKVSEYPQLPCTWCVHYRFQPEVRMQSKMPLLLHTNDQ